MRADLSHAIDSEPCRMLEGCVSEDITWACGWQSEDATSDQSKNAD